MAYATFLMVDGQDDDLKVARRFLPWRMIGRPGKEEAYNHLVEAAAAYILPGGYPGG